MNQNSSREVPWRAGPAQDDGERAVATLRSFSATVRGARDSAAAVAHSAGEAASAGVRTMQHRRAWLTAVPIAGVNSIAFLGQLGWLRDNLRWFLGGQILFAAVLESIAVYLAWQAHLAQKADDSALRLRLAAYLVAGAIGAMNYSHYCGRAGRPTVLAVAFALCSVISPWLWSIHSRRESRDELKDRGLIEPHAVRLGGTRWALHPYRSFRVMFHATWAGETDPARAIALIGVPRTWPERRETARAVRAFTDTAQAMHAAGTFPAEPAAESAVPAVTPVVPAVPARVRVPVPPRPPKPAVTARNVTPLPARTEPFPLRGEHEHALVDELVVKAKAGVPLPEQWDLAKGRLNRNRRAAARVLAHVAARLEGGDGNDDDRASRD